MKISTSISVVGEVQHLGAYVVCTEGIDTTYCITVDDHYALHVMHFLSL